MSLAGFKLSSRPLSVASAVRSLPSERFTARAVLGKQATAESSPGAPRADSTRWQSAHSATRLAVAPQWPAAAAATFAVARPPPPPPPPAAMAKTAKKQKAARAALAPAEGVAKVKESKKAKKKTQESKAVAVGLPAAPAPVAPAAEGARAVPLGGPRSGTKKKAKRARDADAAEGPPVGRQEQAVAAQHPAKRQKLYAPGALLHSCNRPSRLQGIASAVTSAAHAAPPEPTAPRLTPNAPCPMHPFVPQARRRRGGGWRWGAPWFASIQTFSLDTGQRHSRHGRPLQPAAAAACRRWCHW